MTDVQYSLVFIDLTTDATPANLKPGPYLLAMIAGITEGLAGPFAAEYGQRSVAMRVGGVSDRGASEIAVNFRDTIPEAPSALAYHTVTGGVPDIEVGVDLFSDIMTGQDPMGMGVDHEIKELLNDDGANLWADRQDGSNQMDAREMCDFVQNVQLKASSGMALSNFVRRAMFIPGAPGPWDWAGAMKSQYDVSNGYGIVATSPTNTSQVGGMAHRGFRLPTIVRVVGSLTAMQAKRKSRSLSRTLRRGVHPSHVHLLGAGR